MKIKQLFKKAAAMVMAAVTVLSALPATTAFAATGDVGTISFTRTYDSDGNIMRYNSGAEINGYTAGGTGAIKYRMYVDGNTAFCIQPGVPLKTGDTLKESSSATWNALSASQQKAVGLALLYGYQGNRDSLTGSDDEKWMATQTLVWEFVTGSRNATGSYAQTSSTVYSLHFGSNYPNEGARVAYEQIVSLLERHNTVPSFMNGGSRELEYKDGRYTLTLTDSNGVLADFNFSSSNSSVSITKSGNTLTISSAEALNGSVRITATRNNIPVVSESAKLIAYGDDSLQDVVTGVENAEPVSAYLNIDTPTGNVELKKTSEDGVVAGIRFTIEGNGIRQTVTTDENGSIRIEGVEIDSISGRIAQQLYQNSSIAVNGFEKVQMPDSFFDVAIGNVPFGDFRVRDRKYDKNHWLIHDYFFGKTLDKVRPGGVISFITSKGTMDKENSAVRKYLAQRADLIGAIRLPNNAFKANAGTEVTSDIIFLQKRDRMTDIEPDWVHLDTDENGIRMNRYFVQHPEMVLGEMVMESTRFGMDSTCRAYEDTDLSELISEAVQNLHAQITDYEVEELDEEEDHSIPADPAVRNFSYTIVEGKVYYRENSRMYPIEVSVTAENRIRGMIAIRECVRKLIEYQTEGYPDEDIHKEQAELNRLYDDYTKKYGLLSSRGNNLAFGEDSSYCLLCSLEVLDEEDNLKRKADMFSKRTIRPHEAVTSVDTASEALAVSISEKARVDMEYMAELSGKSEEELAADLSGVIFRDIQCAEEASAIPKAFVDLNRFSFVAADEYLSGNVRRKLRMARALYEVLPAEKKPLIAKNIEALEAMQPVDLTAAEIGVRISANWVPVEIYQQFMEETFGTSYYARSRIKILRSGATGQWAITDKNADRSNIKVTTTYGTKRMNAYQILEQTLNQRDVRVFDYVEDENGNKKPVLNKKETAIAQDRQELIKQRFSEWIWKDIDRRERLCRIYNETFNSIRPREYDGSHIRFSGMNPEITLRPHQVNAIAHIMYGGNTLLAHEVGAGKTYEMVAAAMEMKRLGLCTKSLIVVPNHITEQWAAEWLQLYPSANILVATKKDFETRNRKKFCARIATGDYDAVIIGHSQFEKIPMSAERQAAILQQQIDEIMFGIEDAKAAKAERYTVKQLERTRKSLEAKLERLNDQSRKDDLVTFEELGVDRVFVDESHYFKNLFLATKMRNVGGIAQTEAQKSSDLFMKCRYLDEITGGRGVIFATGTPISNSMVELYTIQRYLQYSTLEEMGLVHFDDWASDYGETITAIELSPEGSGYRAKTRFAKFFNLPELMSVFKQVADIQTADMLKLPVPKANFHTEVIQPSELQQEMVRGLAERAEKIRAGGVAPRVDNMLRITNDGRKLALDMRLINPLAADDPNGKVATCARNVYRIWEQTKEQRSAQLVFCDLSTPSKTRPIEMQENGDGVYEMIPDQFTDVYNDLKKKLVEAGIPEEEIAFIHDANTEARKKELFARVRSGQVRILLGRTQKMGAGTNVQDHLIALHDLDCPWRPSDLQQRLGRIVRQGNENPEVEIFRYVTEGTFDAYLYQLVENKQKFIAQIMTSKAPVRVADDVDETALSYSEIKALATGNPLIIEKCNLDMEVGKLNMLKASYLSQKYALEDMVLKKYPEAITRLTERIAGYEQDVQLAAAHPKP